MASTVELFDRQSWSEVYSLDITTFIEMVSKYYDIIFARIVLVYLYYLCSVFIAQISIKTKLALKTVHGLCRFMKKQTILI